MGRWFLPVYRVIDMLEAAKGPEMVAPIYSHLRLLTMLFTPRA